jgi:hypothetical protein
MARFRFPHREFFFRGAGHGIGGAVPYGPERGGFGGSLRADAAARAQLWSAILAMLQRMQRSASVAHPGNAAAGLGILSRPDKIALPILNCCFRPERQSLEAWV